LRISDLEQTCQTIKESINSKVYFAKKKLTRLVIHLGASEIDVGVERLGLKHKEGGTGIDDP
jgi:hypothetical protein